MTKKFLFFILIFVHGLNLSSQNDSLRIPQNAIYLTIFGDGSVFSFNYERYLDLSPEHFFAFKAGVGMSQTIRIMGTSDSYNVIPHALTFNIGNGKHFFEAGIGAVYRIGDKKTPYFGIPTIGYRLNFGKSTPIFFRFHVDIPVKEDHLWHMSLVPLGISLGIRF